MIGNKSWGHRWQKYGFKFENTWDMSWRCSHAVTSRFQNVSALTVKAHVVLDNAIALDSRFCSYPRYFYTIDVAPFTYWVMPDKNKSSILQSIPKGVAVTKLDTPVPWMVSPCIGTLLSSWRILPLPLVGTMFCRSIIVTFVQNVQVNPDSLGQRLYPWNGDAIFGGGNKQRESPNTKITVRKKQKCIHTLITRWYIIPSDTLTAQYLSPRSDF